jgi:CHAT domain-containing protein/tetratricopeptide (TPR) repeat protein
MRPFGEDFFGLRRCSGVAFQFHEEQQTVISAERLNVARGIIVVRKIGFEFGLACALAATLAVPVAAQTERPSIANSFRLGDDGVCQVQSLTTDAAFNGIFDRAWSIVCRDAARPIGKLYALRGNPAESLSRMAGMRKAEADCAAASATSETVEELGTISTQQCKLIDAPVGYKVLSKSRGNILWVAEGLSGYDSALKLGLRTIISDRTIPGKITIATTSIEDPVAFARVQAGTLDPVQALAEGYRRNNSGNYAEAAEFFETLQQRTTGTEGAAARQSEYVLNRALQKSNLGSFAEADTLFDRAEQQATSDPIQLRLRRNFRVMHLINQQRFAEALKILDIPIGAVSRDEKPIGTAVEISAEIAAELNSGALGGRQLGSSESNALTPEERGIFLDAQAAQLRGTLLRLSGRPGEGRQVLERALKDVISVRDGRVTSAIRLRAQILAEKALALEGEGDASAAETAMRESLGLLETRYPQTVAVNGARARLAALLARRGKTEEALREYRTIVAGSAGNASSTGSIGNLLSPYFALIASQIGQKPELVDDLFLASQTLVRPGVADTQAILSRELSEGSGEATRLFRQARTLAREIEKARIDLANLSAATPQTQANQAAIAATTATIATLERDQVAVQAKLNDFPQYRAIASSNITLADLKATLKPGEAYYKLSITGNAVYALFVDATGATGYRLPITSAQLETTVDALRDTIIKDEAGQLNTYPFDVKLSRKLYLDLFGPIAARIEASRHLIFEPDGAMLRLPINLLVTAQRGVDAYEARAAAPDADQFDFRGIDWLGRGRAISTAVSARAFKEARATPASTATREYLGFGQNAPVGSASRFASVRGLTGTEADNCTWPAAEWNKPISASELREVQSIVGADKSTLVTEAAFTDAAVMARTDLNDYRIIHFATHGLVAAPKPECPARPALLTSFGGGASDGLLTFSEIYGLRLNADLVILSACDTAGKASVAATREAGVTTGGGSALDGLVRAFVGAGGRSIVASHWPAPDDFKATERLISGLFKQPNATSVGDAMATAQSILMDDANTSHPYYWSGFAIVGDGDRKLLSQR